MIDSNIIGNFITKNYVETKKYLIQDKKQFYKLVNLNNILFGNNSRWISTETILLPIVFQKHYKELVFNIINIINYNIILGIL